MLKEPILRKSRSLKINAELRQRLSSKKEENFKSFRKITMMMLEDSWKSKPSNSNLLSNQKNLAYTSVMLIKNSLSSTIKSRELRNLSKLNSTMSDQSRVMPSKNPRKTMRF